MPSKTSPGCPHLQFRREPCPTFTQPIRVPDTFKRSASSSFRGKAQFCTKALLLSQINSWCVLAVLRFSNWFGLCLFRSGQSSCALFYPRYLQTFESELTELVTAIASRAKKVRNYLFYEMHISSLPVAAKRSFTFQVQKKRCIYICHLLASLI